MKRWGRAGGLAGVVHVKAPAGPGLLGRVLEEGESNMQRNGSAPFCEEDA